MAAKMSPELTSRESILSCGGFGEDAKVKSSSKIIIGFNLFKLNVFENQLHAGIAVIGIDIRFVSDVEEFMFQ